MLKVRSEPRVTDAALRTNVYCGLNSSPKRAKIKQCFAPPTVAPEDAFFIEVAMPSTDFPVGIDVTEPPPIDLILAMRVDSAPSDVALL